MKKSILTIILFVFSFFGHGQSDLEIRFSEANSKMSLRNMYQRIMWNMSPLNHYFFDQKKGEIKYLIAKNGCEVIAKIKILGTFNLDENTFLWSDKNPSINEKLNDKINAFKKSLPKIYQKDKFNSSTEFNQNLLSLFSSFINANGFDIQRQQNTIIYYSLLEISVFKKGEKINLIKSKNHIQVLAEQNYVDIIFQFHVEKLEINKLFKNGKIKSDEAFKKIKNVHLKYWLNEDSYFFPSLCWPCEFNEKSVFDWKEFKTDDDRRFVMYTTKSGSTFESYAYEIDLKAIVNKVIINRY